MAKEKEIQPKVFQYNNKHTGELVYCKTNKLKSFVKDKVYKIKKYDGYMLFLEGIRYPCGSDNFDFVENNPAISRDVEINKLMDIDFITNRMPEKKLDTIENKNKFIAKLLISRLAKFAGTVDKEVQIQDFSFETLAKEVISTHKKTYQITMEDIEFAETLSFKELIDILK